MRVLALDVGRRRIGIAISDPSAILARPLRTLDVAGKDPVVRVADEVARIAAEEEGLGLIVVGVPRHLSGEASDQTREVERFIARLRERVSLPIAVEDERLTSREAESRLAERERDWRARKARLDAAAAAIILQDFLDRQPGVPGEPLAP